MAFSTKTTAKIAELREVALKTFATIMEEEDEEEHKFQAQLKLERTWRFRIVKSLGWDLMPWYVPCMYSRKRSVFLPEDQYELTEFERLFVCLDDSASCVIGNICNWVVMLVIALNIIIGIILTTPAYHSHVVTTCPGFEICVDKPDVCPGVTICEPQEDRLMLQIDFACVIIFTIEYGSRFVLSWFVKSQNVRLLRIVPKTWDEEEKERVLRSGGLPEDIRAFPKYSFWYAPIRYLFLSKNIIDFLSVVPYYITLAGSGVSLAFIRVLRLVRILRAFKLKGGGVMRVMVRSLKDSIEPLVLLFLSTGLIILTYGALAYTLEQGEYAWRCDWDTGFDGVTAADGGTCRGGYLRPNLVGRSVEESPFISTLMGMYYACITMTTVGYGDMYPTTTSGRCLAVLTAYSGLIMMALPISILGNNFSSEYRKYKKAMADEQEYRIEQMKRLSEIQRKKIESRKALGRLAAKTSTDQAAEAGTGSSLSNVEVGRLDAGKDINNREGRGGDVLDKCDLFEALEFQYNDEELPPSLPPISLPAAASASGPGKTSYAFDQVLVWENEVMAKALSESSEKDDVVLMLQECFARLKMTAKANDKANLALEKINAGVSGMEALIKVFQRLQDAQEISQTVIGRGSNETFD